ncbi:hypothetical protein O6H91_13G082700 [Diphasiastrum complanatum]|uniref:Uncharacterized protein n=1 Tax=Diphasiastrum complanatum TaxID=34168 RepID=A0ACC2BWR6_DIPCM|nr:hypothetical protein O6H91_13G082700 [Diphasiastrum complanatum]
MAKDGRTVKVKRSLCTTILAALLLLSVALLLLLAAGLVGVPSGLSRDNASIGLRLPESSTVSMKQLRDLKKFNQCNTFMELMAEDFTWLYLFAFLIRQRDDGSKSAAPLLKIISWEPRAVIYHNFLSDKECDHLINLAKPSMVKSTVVDSLSGASKDSRVRTSSGTFLDRGHDSIISGIEKRIAQFTFIPIEQGEGLQVLHYEVGQKYEPHYDYFYDTVNTKNGGQRIATVLMYLTDVEAGGETVFPKGRADSSSIPWWNELSECAKAGLSVRPQRGDALLFWSMTPNATVDPMSLHGGCPVIRGDKWSATKWLRVEEYAVP